ncbi:MAG: ABC transporter permease [Lachnospiraceae bacterium]|nr:ABC transporter permease [Lachnospiraceae bacterium]
MQAFRILAKDKLAMLGLVVVVILILLSLFAPFITVYGFDQIDIKNMNSGPTLQHIMGTDALGRDIFTRLLYGGRWSLGLGLSASILSVAIGIVVGSVAGYFGGATDNVIMRLCDIIQAIPATMISIIISISLGTGYVVTIFALALGSASNNIRLMRGQVLSVRKEEYLEAAQCVNCSSVRIMFRHIMPNVMSPMILTFTMSIGKMIMVAAGLSVIGLGVQPPNPEWGAMLSAGRNYIIHYPHLVIFPGLFIFVTGFAINLLGDGLRDAIDPKLKK